jgi:hypothetical protein
MPRRPYLDRDQRLPAVYPVDPVGSPAAGVMERPTQRAGDLEEDLQGTVQWMDELPLGIAIAGALFLILTVAWSALQ